MEKDTVDEKKTIDNEKLAAVNGGMVAQDIIDKALQELVGELKEPGLYDVHIYNPQLIDTQFITKFQVKKEEQK